MKLATKFGNTTAIRSDYPLSDEQIMKVAPSIFATDPHASRSTSYAYIPTITVLEKLRKEGFSPFMACQARCRDEGKREFTKHMLRLRHASQINSTEANEIVLLNSHDGTSSYQMLSGVYRFVCSNGMVSGNTQNDIRIRHKGNVEDNVIEGAFRVLKDFEEVSGSVDNMKSLTLNDDEQKIFARSALELKYDSEEGPMPVTETQILQPRRPADFGGDLWTTLNRVQENMVRGGIPARTASGKIRATRAVTGIDQNVKLNRALWLLAEGMKKLKA